MEAIVEANQGMRLLKVDVDTWGSEVATQCGIRSLPALWLYDGTELVSKNVQEVCRILEE